MLFDRLVLDWKIRRAQRLKGKNIGVVIEALRDYIVEEGEVPSKDQVQFAIMTGVDANRVIDEYVAVLETDYWIERAQRYLLPTPKGDGLHPVWLTPA